MENTLREMREVYRLPPDANVYKLALDELVKAGETKRAVGVFKQVKSEGLLTPKSIQNFFLQLKEESIPSEFVPSFKELRKKVEEKQGKEFTPEEVFDLDQFLAKLA